MALRFDATVARDVLRTTKLAPTTTVQALVEASKPFDKKGAGAGYISKDEFLQGAAAIAAKQDNVPTTVNIGGYRFSRNVALEVVGEFRQENPGVRFDIERLVDAASTVDDGNRYLNRSELTAGKAIAAKAASDNAARAAAR